MSTTTSPENEVTILARVLGDERGELSPEIARHILGVGFSDRDKARMNDLATRNQEGALSTAEQEEMAAFSKAGTMLSILKSKARRALGVKLELPTY
ncbi:hypothetical protein [Paludisphaera borealis]|uniref:Uncharacterized protein n=1 Tax=Paludisphaera borealis TaxID=1387353 RepID=A0A1U7CRQ8_9BACT|nr:hypothetical protein [Paludisphaera borealis]APW61579.1 hypothetical protein BSF38_03097 [Paludisphaera borealis]